jgi:chromosome segregation ATPase
MILSKLHFPSYTKEREIQQLASRWADLEKKLEERKIAIEEALKCTVEIENETLNLQNFLSNVSSDLAAASRLPPQPDTVSTHLNILKEHQLEIPEMHLSAEKAQQAAEFLAQVASGAENHGTKSQSAIHALTISEKKINEKVDSLGHLLASLESAYETRNALFESLDKAEKNKNLQKEELDAIRQQYESLASLVEHISENTSPIRNNSLRYNVNDIKK